MLQARAAALGQAVTLIDYDPKRVQASRAGCLSLLSSPLAAAVTAGQPDPRNAAAVLTALRRAAGGCESGEFAAMVTAPINKAVISDSGIPFLGHTEYLAELTGCAQVVMLLCSGSLRVALATTHIPLSAVSTAITRESLARILDVCDRDLRGRFGIAEPRISVLGINPHAGEGGHLGREEIDTVLPAIEAARQRGLRVTGPWPADTAFNPRLRNDTDLYLAMYHDQGLPVLKYASFGEAVNVSLGLPIIRCSVDHGTAFDLAGSGKADAGSFFAALDLALDLARVKSA
jgi:4-hydroxythreonine-4-phosphate dehydrogenase